jgi:hypothetical protein
MPYHACYAGLRSADSLREAHSEAVRLGAGPLRKEIEQAADLRERQGDRCLDVPTGEPFAFAPLNMQLAYPPERTTIAAW